MYTHDDPRRCGCNGNKVRKSPAIGKSVCNETGRPYTNPPKG